MARTNNTDDEATINFFDPSTATTGLVDNIDLTIVSGELVEYDFNGKNVARDGKSGVVLALHLGLEDADGAESDGPHAYFPCGAIEDFIPADDGMQPVPITGKRGFHKNSAIMQLIRAAIKAGVPSKVIATGRADMLVGYTFHWAQTEKEGGQQKEGERTKTLLLPKSIVSAPGKAAAGAAKTTAKAAGKTKPTPVAEDEDEGNEGETDPATDAAIALVIEVLGEESPLDADAIAEKVFAAAHASKDKQLKDKAFRKRVVELVSDADFLAEQAGAETWMWNPKKKTATAI